MTELSGDVPLSIYADWLEEQGDDTELLRLLIEGGWPVFTQGCRPDGGAGYNVGANSYIIRDEYADGSSYGYGCDTARGDGDFGDDRGNAPGWLYHGDTPFGEE